MTEIIINHSVEFEQAILILMELDKYHYNKMLPEKLMTTKFGEVNPGGLR